VLAEYILGNIDDDGYLRRELEAIADDLAFSIGLETTYEALHEVLMIIQEFDPAGVGARSLQECLILQIDRKEQDDPVTGLWRDPS
jgi:RNA polymerase sigma-54 factor